MKLTSIKKGRYVNIINLQLQKDKYVNIINLQAYHAIQNDKLIKVMQECVVINYFSNLRSFKQ